MRLIRAMVSDWRGLTHTVVFGRGLTVISGPNEAGKSRLFEALFHAFFEPSKGKGKARQALMAWTGSEPPRVTVEFELGTQTWLVYKQFVKGEATRLEGGGATWHDAEAEARLRELLGTRSHGAKRVADEHRGVWPLLWRQQGTSTAAPHQSLNADARSQLRDALAEEVAEAAAGLVGRAVLERAEAEYLTYWGRHGRLLKIVTDAEKAVVQATARCQEREREQREVEAWTAERARLVRARDSSEQQIAEQEQRLANAREVAASAREAEQALLTARAVLQARIAESEGAQAALAAAEAQHEAAAQLASQRLMVDELGKAHETRRTALSEASAMGDLVRLAEQHQARDTAQARLEEAHRLVAALDELTGELTANPVTPEVLTALRDAHAAVEQNKALVAAHAVTLQIEAEAALSVGGEPLASGDRRTWSIGADGLHIAGVGTLRPHSDSLHQADKALADAAVRLEEQLAAAGVTDLAQAEELGRVRRAWEADRRATQSTLDRLVPEGLAAVERAATAELPARPDAVPSADQVTTDIADAAHAEAVAAKALTKAQGRLEALDGSPSTEPLPDRAALMQASTRAARLVSDAASDESAAVERHQAAGGEHAVAQEARERGVLAELRNRLQDVVAQIAGLEARLDSRPDAARAVAEAEEVAHLAHSRHASVVRRANAARVLREALHAARDAAQRRLVGPVEARVGPRLERLFPGSRVSLSDDWTLNGLRTGHTTETFGALSAGAREQLGLLVRLALADVVGSTEPLPVVLDDALVHTDAARRAVLFDLLAEASTTQQIVLLTCGTVPANLDGTVVRLPAPVRGPAVTAPTAGTEKGETPTLFS